MFNFFLNKFCITQRIDVNEDKSFYKNLPTELFNLIDLFGGSSFSNGLYRIHTFRTSLQWSLLIGECFPAYQSKIYPFGFDWMGRQFCIDNDNKGIIFMFDPAMWEDLKMKKQLSTFHNEDLIDGLLGEELFSKVAAFNNIREISFNECLGYKRPLFLGGKDTIENYEKQDLEVYWHITNQLYKKTRDLPEGTTIRNIKIE